MPPLSAADLLLAALAAGEPETALPRVLAALRERFQADAVLALRKIDPVTALALASAPRDLLPDGMTHVSIFADALATGRPVFDAAVTIKMRLPRSLRGTVSILPWSSADLLGGLVLVRRDPAPFSADDQRALENVLPLIHVLASLQRKTELTGALSARFDAIFQTLPHALVFVDDGGVEAWVNEAAAALLKLPEGSHEPARVARSMAALWSRAEDRAALRSTALAVMSQRNAELRNARWSFEGPPRRVLSISSSPTNAQGHRGRLWLFIDVTEPHLAQEELEAKNVALEAARKEADLANAAKSRFLATMSHEIRTPMNAVLGLTGVLLDTPLDEAQREVVETIRGSGDALLTIINDILDFSKIEAGLMDLEEQPFALRPCVDEALDLVAIEARKKGVDVYARFDPKIPSGIFGDVTRLRQVLVNLLGNAVKFTAAGAVLVKVAPEDPDPPSHLDKCVRHFSVRDTGIGIHADRLGRLFQSFSQVDASISRKYGGTGLGLVICRRLVELMHGRIWVESEPGVGTTFHFTITATPAHDIGRLARAPRSPAIDATLGERLPLRILLAEDNVVNQKVATLLLERLGYRADIAANGLEVLEAVTRKEYDLVLMDIQMPEMDGLEATRRLRGPGPFRGRPRVVAVTANAMMEDRRECLAAGMDDFVSKPIRIDELVAALERSFSLERPKPLAPVRLEPPREEEEEKPLVDADAFERLRQVSALGGEGTLETLVTDFIADARRNLEAMGAALSAGELRTLERLAHNLKGSAGMLGATRLSCSSADIEQKAREGDAGALPRLVEAALHEHSLAAEALVARC